MYTTCRLLAIVGVHAVICAAHPPGTDALYLSPTLAHSVTATSDQYSAPIPGDPRLGPTTLPTFPTSYVGQTGPVVKWTPPPAPPPPPPRRTALPQSISVSSLAPRDDPVSFCHHKEAQGIYYVHLVTTQKPDELCGGLWDNLKRHEGICPVGTPHDCSEHSTRLPPNGKGEQKYVTSWHFYVPPACNGGAVESAIWEATSPHVEGLQCTKEEDAEWDNDTSVEESTSIMASRSEGSRMFNSDTDFCHHTTKNHNERTQYNIQLVTRQSSPGLCGGLWDNLKRNRACAVSRPNGCGEHETHKSDGLPRDSDGQPQYMTGWYFTTSNFCSPELVLAAVWEATEPHIEGLECTGDN